MIRRLATTATLAAALTVAPYAAPAAYAEEPAGALISLDQVTFSASPQGSIFPAGVVLIPGSSATATFWVRNASGVPTELRISVADASATVGAFIDSLTMAAATPSTPAGAPVPLSTSTGCIPLLAGEVLEPGETTEVRLALALAVEAGNEGQGSAADARLAVTLADASAGPAHAASGCEGGAELLVVPSGRKGSPSEPAPAHSEASEGSAPPSDGLPLTVEAGTEEGRAALGASPAESSEPALPTLSLSEHPAFYPGVIAGGVLLAAAAAVLILSRRRRSRDAED